MRNSVVRTVPADVLSPLGDICKQGDDWIRVPFIHGNGT